jgi:hypothetical protein
MEFPRPPDDWIVLEGHLFQQAEVRDAAGLGIELLAQLRGNGRIQDHCRIAVGGLEQLEVRIKLSEVFSDAGAMAGASILLQIWPRDIEIRRNLTTSAWMDVRALIERRDVIIEDQEGSYLTADEVCKQLDKDDKKREHGGSIRWAVAVASDGTLKLDCQALPGRAETVAGKPLLNG